MGQYIEGPSRQGKAGYLAMTYGAKRVSKPASYASIPQGMALIAVAHKEHFEAACFVYDEKEFSYVMSSEGVTIEFLYLDRLTTELLAGCYRAPGTFPDFEVKDPQAIKAAVRRITEERQDGETVPETMKRLGIEG